MTGASPDSSDRSTSGPTSSAIGEIVSMFHPKAVVIFSALVLVIAVIAKRGALPLREAATLVLSMAFIQIAVGILNDYCDRDLDAMGKPYRALPAGLVTARCALATGWLGFVLGLGMAATLGLASMLVIGLGGGMGMLYSLYLKRSALSWLPYAIAYPIVPVWVWVSLGMFRPELLLVFPLTVPLALGIHVCNQLRDYDEDAAQGMKGLVQYLGKITAGRLCVGFLVFGPFPALALTRGLEPDTILLWGSVLIHWLLVALSLTRARKKPGAEVWRSLFKCLQVSAPLMFISWLLSGGP